MGSASGNEKRLSLQPLMDASMVLNGTYNTGQGRKPEPVHEVLARLEAEGLKPSILSDVYFRLVDTMTDGKLNPSQRHNAITGLFTRDPDNAQKIVNGIAAVSLSEISPGFVLEATHDELVTAAAALEAARAIGSYVHDVELAERATKIG